MSFNGCGIGAEIGTGPSCLQRYVCDDRIVEDKGNRCRHTTAQTLGARFQIVTVLGEMGENEVPVPL